MRSLLLLIFCLTITSVQAQKMSWRKHAKLAKKQMEEGNFAEAAENFEAAWNKKKKKKKYIFQAAECYYEMKNYRKAAECYEHVKEESNEFMLAGLKYCRSLKMDGQFDEASRAFVYFINGYNEDDKELVAEIVQNEIRGCEFAMSLLEKESKNISIERLSDKVNSNGGDFAPVPFSDDVLYYTSNMVGETKMYLTQKSNGVWTRSKVPKNFPKIAAAHFGNGAFSPDNKTFFYTECTKIDAIGRMIYDCQIYVTQRTDTGWSKPAKLNNNVNRAGSSTTHPFVVHEGNEEVLYFSSNRNGGQGGMDIWKSTRPAGSEKMNFSKPVNLGKKINSIADEITPYLDINNNILYFSSNGNVNVGGFDIFKAVRKTAITWENPKNMGFPFNSSADDYYFRKFSPEGGYIVSNRKFGLEKTDYSNDDIYAFSAPMEKMMAMGNVMQDDELVTDISLSLYEIMKEGNVRLLENKTFESGVYEFGLLPDKNYRIEAVREGMVGNGVEFTTIGNDQMKFQNDIILTEATENFAVEDLSNIDMEVSNTTEETITTTSNSTGITNSTTTSNGSFSNPQPTAEMNTTGSYATNSTAPTTTYNADGKPVTTFPSTNTNTNTVKTENQAVVYKIQLMAVKKYRDNDPRLRAPKSYGNIETEFLPGRNLTRVFLTSFTTLQEAEEVLEIMKDQRSFRTAVVVRYENGVRIDPWQK